MKMESWDFLTSHARVLLCIARDPGVRLRGQPGHHRAQRLRHRHRPDRSRLRGEAERRPPQPLPDPGTPPAARNHQPATRHRRSPRLSRGHQRETAGDPDRASLRPPQLSGVHAPRQTAGAEVRPGWSCSSLRAAEVVRHWPTALAAGPVAGTTANRPATRQDQARVSSHQLRLHVPPTQPESHSCRCR
jgi:hypothetical protein